MPPTLPHEPDKRAGTCSRLTLGALGGVRPRPGPAAISDVRCRRRMLWCRTVWHGWGEAPTRKRPAPRSVHTVACGPLPAGRDADVKRLLDEMASCPRGGILSRIAPVQCVFKITSSCSALFFFSFFYYHFEILPPFLNICRLGQPI